MNALYNPAVTMKVPDPDRVSKVSKAIGRLVLRGGRYPWRHVVGFRQRERSRQQGGRRFTVERPGGWALDAWFVPARKGPAMHPDPAGLPAGDARPADRLPVVFSHGIFEFKERHFDRARWLSERGHDVILYDHRTHGKSGGDRITFGVEEREDLRALIDAAQQRGYIGQRLVSMGFSLGGGTALQHAAVDDRVAGVVAIAPFADFESAVRTFRECFTPWLDADWLQRGMHAAAAEAGFAMEQASALEAIPRIRAPILLVEGGRDPFLPPRLHTQELAKLRGDLPMTICRIEEAHHVSLVRRRWEPLDDALGVFLDGLDQPHPSV